MCRKRNCSRGWGCHSEVECLLVVCKTLEPTRSLTPQQRPATGCVNLHSGGGALDIKPRASELTPQAFKLLSFLDREFHYVVQANLELTT